jgi:hypothetical protein
MPRLRAERLAKLKDLLARLELGALLCFDMAKIRYMTATHIATWAMDDHDGALPADSRRHRDAGRRLVSATKRRVRLLSEPRPRSYGERATCLARR